MADVHNKTTRSYNMSRIKGKNTKPEMLVRKFLLNCESDLWILLNKI
ncbi:hypothetical protein [Draconibacterium sediminis]|nr:hypothetical protein [Draconibacterium sediminis]